MSSIELGGFAEWPEVIDGTEEEFEAYNYCLANEYYDAVLGEDFESLGEVLNNGYVWHQIMRDVCNWLNYDGEIGKDLKENFKLLYNGTIITCNNMPFIIAAYEHGWTKLVEDLTREKKDNGFHLKKPKIRINRKIKILR